MKGHPNASQILCKCGHPRSQHSGKSCVMIVKQAQGRVVYCGCTDFTEKEAVRK